MMNNTDWMIILSVLILATSCTAKFGEIPAMHYPLFILSMIGTTFQYTAYEQWTLRKNKSQHKYIPSVFEHIKRFILQMTSFIFPIYMFQSPQLNFQINSTQYQSYTSHFTIHIILAFLVSSISYYLIIYFIDNDCLNSTNQSTNENKNKNKNDITTEIAPPKLISSTNLNTKRDDYLRWDEYFLFTALLSSLRSKDPNTQVGACIVNTDKKIVGIGYNGFPWGCSDDKLPWQRKDLLNNDVNNTKYPYVCHAEMNAILNKNESSLKNCIMYVVLFPCNECAKLIIQSRISKIIYLSDKYSNTPNNIASKKMLDMSGIKYIQYKPKRKSVLLEFPQL